MMRRISIVGFVAVVALWAAGVAGAAEDAKGSGYVQEVDLVARTVTVADRKLQVKNTSTLVDRKGNPVTLEELHIAKPGPMPGIWEIDDADRVDFHAKPAGRGWNLVSLTVVARGPE